MVIFALTMLGIGLLGALGVLCWAFKCSIGHNTPEHGLPPRATMRRYMLLGLYCNPDDPRNIVQHPTVKRAWTMNMRSELAASALWISLAITVIAGLLLIAVLNAPA